MTPEALQDFCEQRGLPKTFQNVVHDFYLPLAAELPRRRSSSAPLFLGINGAQGTGKSTLAEFLAVACKSSFDWNVAVLSIDDFYNTKAEREALAKNVHPLLLTRGVPGTHDTVMMDDCLRQLRRLTESEEFTLPRFDKAIDDRASPSLWPTIAGTVDLVILEGWCVGTKSQTAESLDEPVNELERKEDNSGLWRRYVNEQLRVRYEPIFEQLDAMVFLKAPSFEAIYRWRLQQEQKLAAVAGIDSDGLMNEHDIRRFLQFYERLTRENLNAMPDMAAIVFILDEAHQVADCRGGRLK